MPTNLLRLALLLCIVLLGTFAPLRAAAAYVAECGVIIEDPMHSCIVFQTVALHSYVLEEIEQFAVGDTLFCMGEVDSSCVQPCSGNYPCVRSAFTCPCDYRDLGCGRLDDSDPLDSCKIFSSGSYPSVSLDTFYGFGDGDSVHVKGWLFCPPQWCGQYSVIADSIYRCAAVVPSTRPSWGRLKALYR